MIIHNDIQQRTDVWRQLKIGKLSGSRIKPLAAPKGLGAATTTLALEILTERITGRLTDTPVTYAMEQGLMNEPIARDIYINATGNDVVEVGGVSDGELFFSPDGLIGEDGILEIKSPQPKKHMEILLSDVVLPEYIPQLQFGMYVTNRKWCDFVSYCPEYPDDYCFKIIRHKRDDASIDMLKDRIEQFNRLLENMEKKLHHD